MAGNPQWNPSRRGTSVNTRVTTRKVKRRRISREEIRRRRESITDEVVHQARESVQASGYLIELSIEASNSWERFRSSREPSDLAQTATILCDGLGRWHEDSAFWIGANYFAQQAAQHRYPIPSAINLDALLAIEVDLLAEHVGGVNAQRLVSDITNSLEIWYDNPTPRTVENLRQRIRGLWDATCTLGQPDYLSLPEEQPEEPEGEDSRLFGWLQRFSRAQRVVGRGVLALSGGAVTVVNAAATGIEPYLALTSVMGGLKTVVEQVDKQEQHLPNSPRRK